MASNPQSITLEVEVTGQVIGKFDPPLFGHDRIPSPYTFEHIVNVEHHAAMILQNVQAAFPAAVVQWSRERCEQFVAFRFLSSTRQELKRETRERAKRIRKARD